jgi:hypothetical protein
VCGTFGLVCDERQAAVRTQPDHVLIAAETGLWAYVPATRIGSAVSRLAVSLAGLIPSGRVRFDVNPAVMFVLPPPPPVGDSVGA